MSEQQHFVYVVAHVQDGKFVPPVKIGLSVTPTARLAGLQTGNPRRLGVVHAFLFPSRRLAAHAEQTFHLAMESARLEGEWFEMPVRAAVRLMCVNVNGMATNSYKFEMDTEDWSDLHVFCRSIIESPTAEEGWAWAFEEIAE